MKKGITPSPEEISRAIERACAGKGRQLALLVKACSVDELAHGFNVYARAWGGFHGDGFEAIRCAVNVASGRQQGRNEFRVWLAEERKRMREEAKAKNTGDLVA